MTLLVGRYNQESGDSGQASNVSLTLLVQKALCFVHGVSIRLLPPCLLIQVVSDILCLYIHQTSSLCRLDQTFFFF